jgi:tRNA dimethylallyltransferase
MNTPKLVAVVGETCSGKSALAHLLARDNSAQIICSDSRTIYSKMDIGTAKPSQHDRHEVKYHMLDIVEPNQSYSAAQFQKDAYSVLDKIGLTGNNAVMVGGTGLFVDSVLFDFKFRTQPDRQKRDELGAMSLEQLQALALKIDKNLTKNLLSNKRHLIRLIETGEHSKKHNKLRDNTTVIGLSVPKNALRQRVEQRTEAMFRQGLRKEVDELVKQYGWDCEAMSGIGYREFKDYYDGNCSMTAVKNSIVKNTLKYAKRQRTWFKRNPHIHWFEDPEEAYKYANNFLKQG